MGGVPGWPRTTRIGCSMHSSGGEALSIGWAVDSVTLSAPGCCVSLPSITTQPQNQSVPIGGMAAFNVAAAGSAPLAFQWRFNGTNLPGANATNYTKANAQPADIGGYDVVVTNFAGAITSSVANLTIAGQLILLSPRITNGNFVFILSGNPGYNYSILGTTNLSNWFDLSTLSNITGTVPFTDTNPPRVPLRAYRAKQLP